MNILIRIDHCLRFFIFNLKNNYNNCLTLLNDEITGESESVKIASKVIKEITGWDEIKLLEHTPLIVGCVQNIQEEYKFFKRKILERSA